MSKLRWIAIPALVTVVGLTAAGCAGGGDSASSRASEPGIVLGAGATPSAGGTAVPPPSGSTSPSASIPADAGGSPPGTVIDPAADLDIDDQRGDGTRVVIESLSTSVAGVTLVIVDARGRTVASVPVTPGVQPVTIALDVPLSRSQELRGELRAPDGSGILVDDEGEAVEEDFDYVIR